MLIFPLRLQSHCFPSYTVCRCCLITKPLHFPHTWSHSLIISVREEKQQQPHSMPLELKLYHITYMLLDLDLAADTWLCSVFVPPSLSVWHKSIIDHLESVLISIASYRLTHFCEVGKIQQCHSPRFPPGSSTIHLIIAKSSSLCFDSQRTGSWSGKLVQNWHQLVAGLELRTDLCQGLDEHDQWINISTSFTRSV